LAQAQGDAIAVQRGIEALLAADPYDWKAWFIQGRTAFLQGNFKQAAERFARLRAELPGEPAAQLALALALEAFGEPAAAEPIYDRVSKADPSCASASFGLARCRLAGATRSAAGRKSAVEALNRIPRTSALYVVAQTAIVRVLIGGVPGAAAAARGFDELEQAAQVFAALGIDNQAGHLLAAELLLKAAEAAEAGQVSGQVSAQGATLLGCAARPKQLRFGAERALRRAARFAPDQDQLNALVDRANQARPHTLF
jgi:serine/threonine-protein kinase PknG